MRFCYQRRCAIEMSEIRHITVCEKCGHSELGKPEIWYQGEAGVICPNCKNLWATQDDYLFQKQIGENLEKCVSDVDSPLKSNLVLKFIDYEDGKKKEAEIYREGE